MVNVSDNFSHCSNIGTSLGPDLFTVSDHLLVSSHCLSIIRFLGPFDGSLVAFDSSLRATVMIDTELGSSLDILGCRFL